MPGKQRPQKLNARNVVKEVKLPTKILQVLTVSDTDAFPDELPIDINETFFVNAVTPCYVNFKNHDLFENQHYAKTGLSTLTPKPNKCGTAEYDTSAKAGKKPLYTHSIKVG